VQITYSGVTGWVAFRQVTVSGNLNALPVSASAGSVAPAAPSAPLPSANTGVMLTAQAQVNITNAPASQFSILGSIPAGTPLPAQAGSKVNVGLLVNYNGISGWSESRLFTVTGNVTSLPVSEATGSGSPANAASAAQPANTRTITVNQQVLND